MIFLYGKIKMFKKLPKDWNQFGAMNAFVGSEVIVFYHNSIFRDKCQILFHKPIYSNDWNKLEERWWIDKKDLDIVYKKFNYDFSKVKSGMSFFDFCKNSDELIELLI